jgi:hypothetical protein
MAASASYGTLLQMGDGGTPAEEFTTIAGVKDISGPALSRDLEETTSHDADDGYETHVPTIKRSGEVSFDINWDPADGTHDDATGLVALVGADEPTNFRVVYPRQGFAWDFSAYVTSFETSAPVAGVLGASVTMKITGRPTLGAYGS